MSRFTYSKLLGIVTLVLPLTFVIALNIRTTANETKMFGDTQTSTNRTRTPLKGRYDKKYQNLLAQNPATQQRRIALVIGNANYNTATRLNNPINDATDIARRLEQIGFEVTLLQDVDLREMEQGIEQFNRQLRQGGVGLFYFSGHGVQLEGDNYLIPVNARLQREQDVRYEAFPVGKLLNVIEDAGNQANIIILDACRNNPFGRSWRSNIQGLAAPAQGVTGVLIAYATAPGKVALDGEGRNSPYTSAMLRYITTPNLDVTQLFQRVRADVYQQTRGQQTPWESSSLIGKFAFNPGSDSISHEIPTPAPIPSLTPTVSSPPKISTTSPSPDLVATSETKQPSLPPTLSTNQDKPRMAVLDFDYSSVADNWSWWWKRSAVGVSNILVNKLVEDGNFVVVERSKLEEIIKEQNLGASGRIDTITAAKIGRLLGVDIVVLGSITGFNIERSDAGLNVPVLGNISSGKTTANVKLNIRLVHTTTGEILFTSEGNGRSDSGDLSMNTGGYSADSTSSQEAKLLTSATVAAIEQVVKNMNTNSTKIADIPKALPSVNSLVADISGNTIILNKGLADGYRQGVKLSIERVSRQVKDPVTGKVIRQVTRVIGKIEITEADAQSSVAKIIDGSGFKIGDIAKPSN